ncbi:MAG: TonB-dependent receptor, partial [Sandarakinorhabdus sp.]|nr:TonB-dependent receptor [Sandarakinorhabdus sp.]
MAAAIDPAAASAQEPSSLPSNSDRIVDAEPAEADIADIIVTGTLIARRGFEAPTPVTTITPLTLERVSAPNIADVINLMPAVRASLRPTSTVNLGGLAAGNFIDLRGIGFQRTQTLVDGRRYVPTTPGGGVSISSIPQALIHGVDVVTGGASATYGSDAVAGVVNLRVDSRFEGVRGSAQSGISTYGDFANYLLSVGFGTRFGGDRLHLVVAGERSENSGIAFVGDRPWAARNPGLLLNPAFTPANDQPRLLLVSGDIRQTNVTYGGVINTAGPLFRLQFLPDGTTTPLRLGTLVTATQMNGGDGANGIADSVGAVPVTRSTAFGRLTIDAAPNIELFTEISYNKLTSRFLGLAATDQITIRRDNVFLPASVRTILAANPQIASFVIGRSVRDNGRIVSNLDIDTIQSVSGIDLDFGAGWTAGVSYSYGRTRNRSTGANNRITANFNLAVDAIDDPRTPAVIDPICRSTIANPANGCVPINLIGEGRASAQAIAYVNGISFRLWDIEQHVATGTLRGSPFTGWAGPVDIALGVERRTQSVDTRSDPISTAQAFRGGGTIPYSGKVDVREAFGELLFPLLADRPGASRLNLNLATRITDYSTSGSVVTWKAGVDWALSDSVRLRATRSRDIRAPSLEELFAAGATSTLNVDDGARGTYLVTAANEGNPDLVPEKADTFTAGLVLAPSALPGLNISVDYYAIELDQAIINLTPATIVTRCITGVSPEACDLITRDPLSGLITRVRNAPVNLQAVRTRGIDVEALYTIALAGADQLRLQLIASYLIESVIDDGFTRLRLDDSVEQPTVAAIGGNPRWRAIGSVDYLTANGRISLTGRYIGGGQISRAFTPKDIDINRVRGRLYVDASFEVAMLDGGDDRVAFFGSVQNVLDTTPPVTGVGGFGTTRALYDTI